ncbi:hypothetical protein OIV83_002174 [Microbotryomycetes sp. JL201]|nr:hypothetical protein OIV83_002174 [Microbotryomycetes sp. JL201]
MSKVRSESPHLAKALGGRSASDVLAQPGSTHAGGQGGGGSGLFNRFVAPNASIKVKLAEQIVYLFPKQSGGIPDWDNSIDGTVALFLPKPRRLRHLTIKLVGKTDVQWTNKAYETFKVLEKTIDLVTDNPDDDGIALEKGEHVFAFSILVPSNSRASPLSLRARALGTGKLTFTPMGVLTASYERCHYGRTRYFVQATAKGLAAFGGDLSNACEVFLVVNPGCARPVAFHSEPPPPLHYKMVGNDDTLGPWSVVLQSQHVMVGGLLQLRFNVRAPQTGQHLVAIQSIRIKVTTHAFLNTPDACTSPYSEVPAPLHQTVCLLNAQHPPNMGHLDDPVRPSRSGTSTPRHGPLTIMSAGERYSISHVTRLLNDDNLRPSTQPGTNTCISLNHDISVEIVHERLEREDGMTAKCKGKHKASEATVMRITKPLTLWSCCCWLDSLVLPAYSEEDPNPGLRDSVVPCMCHLPNSTSVSSSSFVFNSSLTSPPSAFLEFSVMKHQGELFLQPDNDEVFSSSLDDAVVVKIKAGQEDFGRAQD